MQRRHYKVFSILLLFLTGVGYLRRDDLCVCLSSSLYTVEALAPYSLYCGLLYVLYGTAVVDYYLCKLTPAAEKPSRRLQLFCQHMFCPRRKGRGGGPRKFQNRSRHPYDFRHGVFFSSSRAGIFTQSMGARN
jgi:hypothetical protein